MTGGRAERSMRERDGDGAGGGAGDAGSSAGPRASGRVTSSASELLQTHLAVLGRVAMALVGDAERATSVLEQVVRDVGRERPAHRAGVAEDRQELVWLLG